MSPNNRLPFPSVKGVCSCDEAQRPRLLQSLGSFVMTLTHSCAGMASRLPRPFGPTVKYVEDISKPWLYPFVEASEGHVLCLLGFVDDQICVLGTTVKRYVPILSPLLTKMQSFKGALEQALNTVPDALKRRGFLGACADMWIHYEVAVRVSAQKSVALTSRVPLMSVVIRTFCAIASPVAVTISNWLVEHSEVDVKIIQLEDKEPVISDLHVDDDAINEQLCAVAVGEVPSKNDADCDFAKQIECEGMQDYEKTIKEDAEIILSDFEEEKSADPLVELIDAGWQMGSRAVQKGNLTASGSSVSRSTTFRRKVFYGD